MAREKKHQRLIQGYNLSIQKKQKQNSNKLLKCLRKIICIKVKTLSF
jgi:hypothetical protein